MILGNPPYNAYAGVSPKEEQALVEPYKVGLISEWGIKKFNLDDLYVRFFRLAERRIAEQTGQGVVCYISNFSYLDDPSYVIIRQRFLGEFDKLWFDCMNGDSRETGKRTPEGKPDPSVFSTEYNREGIRVGTAISLMVRKERRCEQPLIRFRQFWGVTKRSDLVNSLKAKKFDDQYELVTPGHNTRFSFRSSNIATHYWTWPMLIELCEAYPFNGPIERRGNSLIVFEQDKANLALLEAYLDPNKSNDEIRLLAPRFMKSSGEFKAEKTRTLLRGKVSYDESKISRYPFKPFDVRLAYLDSEIQPLFSRPSPELLALQSIAQNAFFLTRDTSDKEDEGTPFFFSRLICDYDCISGHARHIPLFVPSVKMIQRDTIQDELFNEVRPTGTKVKANLSFKVRNYLATFGIIDPDANSEDARLIWMHALAVGYAPNYLSENNDGIRRGWPRVPLPNSKDLLLHSAELGVKVAALLDTESSVLGVTSGKIRSELRSLGTIWRIDGTVLNPDSGDLDITAGWGHAGKDGVTMPGKGKIVERTYTSAERTCIEEGVDILSLTTEQAIERLGETTHDIYLNNFVYWKNIPSNVWNYTIGGYQVIKKWLSYREHNLLGRGLTVDEAREVMHMARRIATILLLEPALDENYRTIKHSTYSWPSLEGKSVS